MTWSKAAPYNFLHYKFNSICLTWERTQALAQESRRMAEEEPLYTFPTIKLKIFMILFTNKFLIFLAVRYATNKQLF
jgi:hypothetical protein